MKSMLLKQAEVAPCQLHIPLATCLSVLLPQLFFSLLLFEDFQRYMSNTEEIMVFATWLSKLNDNSRSHLWRSFTLDDHISSKQTQFHWTNPYSSFQVDLEAASNNFVKLMVTFNGAPVPPHDGIPPLPHWPC